MRYAILSFLIPINLLAKTLKITGIINIKCNIKLGHLPGVSGPSSTGMEMGSECGTPELMMICSSKFRGGRSRSKSTVVGTIDSICGMDSPWIVLCGDSGPCTYMTLRKTRITNLLVLIGHEPINKLIAYSKLPVLNIQQLFITTISVPIQLHKTHFFLIHHQ